LNATAIPGFFKYPCLVLKKNGFQEVENRQKRVSGFGKPGLETLHPSETIISVGNIKKQHAYFCLNVSVTQND